MSLAARRSTRQREDFVMRLGCFLVSFAVLASLILEPPRAKAFAMTSSAVTALAGGFLNACGLAPVVSGMSSSGEVNESLARLIQDFLDEEHPGIKDAVDWIGDVVLTVNGGRVIIPSETAKRLSAFATWVAGKYGTKAGVHQVYSTEGLLSFHAESSYNNKTGSSILYLDFPSSLTIVPSPFIEVSKSNSLFLTITLEPGTYDFRFFSYSEVTEDMNCAVFTSYSNLSIGPFICEEIEPGCVRMGFSKEVSMILSFAACMSKQGFSHSLVLPIDTTKCWIKRVDEEESSFGLDVSDTMQQVLDRLTALEEGQSIALDVGATQSMEIQEILQGILDAILAGDLAASAEIVDEAVEPVDPPAEELPDVDGLGLPALGAALTSRFPFSIPWDVYKGVTLLAAPPKAPYFEVDFLAPIADRVGGWQGSTKIVLDFSEYEIIGQVCRWTSTIGFCLMLATGTKRLIWTA